MININVLFVHNYYQQPGGEDQVFKDETMLLEGKGHNIQSVIFHNDTIKELSISSKAMMALDTIYNRKTYKHFRQIIREKKPDVVHFHNTFPLVSPSAYYATRAEGVAVIQTLHNYRFLCPNAMLYRENKVCEECLSSKLLLSSIKYNCYKESKLGTMTVAAMLLTNRLIGTYKNLVDVYIALTDFSKKKYIEGGIPENKIIVKPNFVNKDPGIGTGNGGYALFVGRLSQEKGIETLLSAWKLVDSKIPLRIVGDGPLRKEVEEASNSHDSITYLGRKSTEEVYELMGDASVLIFPSQWYEGMPKTIIESFAKGTPVIASRIGSMEDLIVPEQNGFYFKPGNAIDLAERVMKVFTDTSGLQNLRTTTRKYYESKYSAEENYIQLLEIYNKAVIQSKKIN